MKGEKMEDKKMSGVYIIKAALKLGKFCFAQVISSGDDGMIECILPNGRRAKYKKGEWYLTAEEAYEAVEKERQCRIKYCKDQIKHYENEIDCLRRLKIGE